MPESFFSSFFSRASAAFQFSSLGMEGAGLLTSNSVQLKEESGYTVAQYFKAVATMDISKLLFG